MFRTIAAVAAISFVSSHAMAGSPTACDDASIVSIEKRASDVPDIQKKQLAEAELALAKASIRADKFKECTEHLENARIAVGSE